MRWSHFFLPTSTLLATAKLFFLFLPVAHKCYHYSVVSLSSLASQSVHRTHWKPALPSCLTACILLCIWMHVSMCTLSCQLQRSLDSLGSSFFLESVYLQCLPATHLSLDGARFLCVQILPFEELWVFLPEVNQSFGVGFRYFWDTETCLLGNLVAVFLSNLSGSLADWYIQLAPVWLWFTLSLYVKAKLMCCCS